MKKDIKTIPIPVEGSLGLLAYGYEGLVAWRKAKHEARLRAKANAGEQHAPTKKGK